MHPIKDKPEERMDADAVARAIEGHMDSIMQLLEAIAGEEPDADMKLAELLEGKPDQVRTAILEKLRALLRGLAAEKEQELDKYLDADKRVEVERQRNTFLQWLQWIMSEETLRKIREAFLARPGLEMQITGIGHELAARGVLQRHNPNEDRAKLGELAVNAPQVGTGKDQGKGRL